MEQALGHKAFAQFTGGHGLQIKIKYRGIAAKGCLHTPLYYSSFFHKEKLDRTMRCDPCTTIFIITAWK